MILLNIQFMIFNTRTAIKGYYQIFRGARGNFAFGKIPLFAKSFFVKFCQKFTFKWSILKHRRRPEAQICWVLICHFTKKGEYDQMGV